MERRKVYAAAFDADLCRLRATHGPNAIDAALKLIEQQAQQTDDWDAAAHACEVRRAIERVLRERRQRAKGEAFIANDPGQRLDIGGIKPRGLIRSSLKTSELPSLWDCVKSSNGHVIARRFICASRSTHL